jgi:hypothetical protein
VAGGIDGFLSGDLVLGDDGDPTVLDADIGDVIILVSGSITRPLKITRSKS